MDNDGKLDLEEIIRKTAVETVIAMEQRQQKRTTDAMLHNTETLMNHYKALKRYAENGSPGAGTAWGDTYLESIMSSKARTSIMVAEIDAAMIDVAEEYAATGQEYKWRAFHARYVEGVSYEEIAAALNAGKNSPARWCKDVMTKVAVKIFGVDGLKRW